MGTSSTTTCEPPAVMEKILRVTLDIIHLLTGRGEDVVVKKSGDIIVIDPPPYAPTRNDKERIWNLAHEMVELLMGERSLGTSKDVWEDAAQEDPQAVRSSVDGPDVTSRFPGDIMSEKKSPWNITVRLKACSDGDVDRSAEQTQVKIEADDEDHVPTTEERLSLNIKEEPWSEDEAVVSAPVDNSQRTTCQIKEESFSSEGEYSTSNVKEEEILRDSSPSRVIMVKPDSSEEEHHPSDVDNMAAVTHALSTDDCSKCFPSNLAKTKPCPECGENFCCNSALAQHQAAHGEEKAFASTERVSSKPPVTVRQKVQKPLVCSECGQQFSFKSKLVRHQTNHTGEKPLSCPECGKSYGCNAAFLAHRRIHAGKTLHSCPVCGKCFPQKNNLQRHLSIHTGEKPHSCPECGKRFMSKSNLTQHLSVHLPKKKETFCCPECGKCYKRRADFRWHMLIHLGEK